MLAVWERSEYPVYLEAHILWLLMSVVALAGNLRATVEVGPDGPRVLSAVHTHSRAPVTPGELEVLGEDGTVLATAAIPDPRLRTIITPEGGETAFLDRGVVSVEVPWPDGAASLHLRGRQSVPRLPPPPAAIPIQETGDPSERLDLVFLSDGYTEAELGDFAADVDAIVEYLRLIEPYGSYANLMNIWRVDQASTESGISNIGTSENRDTYYGCYYGCASIDRLVCCDDDVVMGHVEETIPDADGIVVLVNDTKYGGSGGFNYATAYVGDQGLQVAAHELGHSLVGLWDEYPYFLSDPTAGPSANCAVSADPHWDEWEGIDCVGVTAYPVCSYDNLYRPCEFDCMMKSLQDDYCPVCRQEAIYAIYARLNGLVISVDPPVETELKAKTNDPDLFFELEVNAPLHGLVYEWSVDGEVFLENEPEFNLRCSGANGQLSLRVYDDTPWVRTDPYGLTWQVLGPWDVKSDDCEPGALACGCAAPGNSPIAGWIAALVLVAWRRRR